MNTQPSWRIPLDADAERECSRLTLGEILDRQMELEKVLEKSEAGSGEYKRAQTMLRATYAVINGRYFKK